MSKAPLELATESSRVLIMQGEQLSSKSPTRLLSRS